MQPKRSNLARSLACVSTLLLAACQQGKLPQAQEDLLNAEPPSAGTGVCPALSSDWLSLLPGEQRRIEPAHCSQHTGTPLLAWADPRNRQLGSSYTLSVRSAGGVNVANRSGLTEPRARLAQALPPGNYEWAVSYTAANGRAQSTQWRSFSVAAADGQASAQDLMDGAQLAAQVSVRARPRMLVNGSNFAALRNAAQQAEHLPALTLLRSRANAALNAQVPAMPGAAVASTAQAKAQALAELAQSARSERQHIEVLGVIGRLDGNANLIAAAKRRLLSLAAWAPSGASSEANASEANREVALAMAQGLDLLWNDLSAAERSQLAAPLRERLMQASNALTQLDREPYAAASLLSLRQITQALLLTAGLPGFPESQSLLANAWELNRHNLQIWGTDGSQGPAIAQAWEQFAATTSMAAAVRTITGLNLYELPVLRRSAEQLIAFTPTSREQQAAFGDDAGTRNLYDRHSAALRLHAQQGRDLASVWYWQAKASNVSAPTDASIWQLLLLGASSSTLPAGNAQLANDWFSSQAGLAAMHSDIRRPDRSSVYFRSSRFGANGAAQAEQNALVYVSQGLPLLIGSGGMPFAGSPHHRNTRASRYKNTLTVDGGFGQAESSVSGTRPSDPLASMDASGTLVRTQSAGSYAAVTGDATNAYRALDSSRNTWTPLLSNAVRSVVMDKANGLTFVYDWATSATPRQWELNYHSPKAFVADASTVRASNGVASVCLDRHGPATQFSQTSSWEVAPEVALPAAAHGRFTSLTRSTEFAHLTVLRESCRNVPLQISQKDAQITVLVNGRDTLQFDRRMFSLPSNAGAAALVPIVALAAATAGTQAGVGTAAATGSTPSTNPTAPAGTPCSYEAKTTFAQSCGAFMSAVFADGESISFANTKAGYIGEIRATCQRGTLSWSAGSCAPEGAATKQKSLTSPSATETAPSLAALKVYVSKPPFYVDMVSGRKRVQLGIYGSGDDLARSHDFVTPLINSQTGRTNALTVQTTAVVNGTPTFVNLSDTSTPKASSAVTTGRFGLEAEGLRVAYIANDPPSSEKLRTQINAWPIPTRIPLTWDLSVKFAGSKPGETWPLVKFTASPVLIWQLKSDPGFPPMGLLVDTDPENPRALQLTFFQRLSNTSAYSNRWIMGGIDPNVFNDIVIQAIPDDRDTQAGGIGMLKVWVNNRLMLSNSGRNLIPGLPDVNRWNFGLYLTAESNPSPVSRYTTWRRARMLSN